jgi:predicted lactoylglutathione lyase
VLGVGAFPASAGVHPLTSVSGVTASISPPSSAAGAVTTYTVGFTTSASGALSQSAGDSITVTVPSGSNVDTMVNTAVDVGGNQVGACGAATTTVASCGLFSGETIPASTAVTVVLGGVTNPGTAGSYKLSVATTKDTTPVNSPSYTVTAAGKVTRLSVAASPTLAAGALTTYTVSFTTSSTGGMAQEAGSTIAVTFPAGSNVDTMVNTEVDAGGNQVGACSATATAVATCGLFSGETIAPSTAVTVVLGGVTNPSTASSYTLSLATTSDTKSVTSPSYTVTAEGKVTALQVTPSSTLAGAANVTYTTQFKADTGMSQESGSQITMTFPSGTGLTALTSTAVTVGGTQVGACSTRSKTVVSCGFFSGETVASGATVVVTLAGITNPAATNAYALKLSTTSDVKTVTTRYCVAASGVPCISKLAPAS